MSALITVNQATLLAGHAGKSRSDGVISQLVTCTNSTVEGAYLWTLVDTPIRSALVRGTTGTGASFTFTPDVKGTYLVSLQVNGSSAPDNNASIYLAVRTFAVKTLAWRYQGASETAEDNEDYVGLGFPDDTNPRAWATNTDLIYEEVETGTWEVQNAITTFSGTISRIIMTDPATGKVHPTLIGTALFADGSVSAPSISFALDANTGFFRPGSGVVAVTGDGTEVARFQAPSGVNEQALFASGNSGIPSISFSAEPTLGIYRHSGGAIGFVSTNVRMLMSFTGLLPAFDNTFDLGAGVLQFQNAYIVRVLLGDGGVTTPALTFSADNNTGIWRPGSGIVAVSGDGVEVVRFQAPSSVNPQVLIQNGTSTIPSLSFFSDADIGFYHPGTNQLAITWGGAPIDLLFADGNVAGGQVRVTPGFNGGSPGLAFTNDPNTGIYWFAADTLGFAAGGGVASMRGDITGSSGVVTGFEHSVVVSQSGTAGYSAWRLNVAETTTGSGAKNAVEIAAPGGTYYVSRTGQSVAQGVYTSATNVVPAHAFTDDTNNQYGLAFTAISDQETSLIAGGVAIACANAASTALHPGQDNVFTLGVSNLRWKDLFAVQTTIGDLTLKDPHGGSAHWKIIEGENELFAYNIRTGRKYAIAMIPLSMTSEDEEKVSSERKRFERVIDG